MEKLIFIIDDDQVYLNFMKGHFRQMKGYQVEVFSTGEEAIQKLQSEKPFLIILDHNFSHTDKDGIFYLNSIKKIKPSVPTIYITSDNSEKVKNDALKAGARAVITKSEAFLVQLRTAIDDILDPKKKGLFSKLFG